MDETVSMQSVTISFVLGLLIGLVVAYIAIVHIYGSVFHSSIRLAPAAQLILRNTVVVDHKPDPSHEDLNNIPKLTKIIPPMHFGDSHAHNDDNSVAKELEKTVKILCWVMTSPQNLEVKAVHVRITWASRCNKLLFISSETNDSFPTVGFDVPEGRDHLTAKTMKAFRYIYDNHFNDADWFMKADDDTYVVMENLRYFLSSQSMNKPVYFGHHFRVLVDQGYCSGGAGYILSKEALKRFGDYGNDPEICHQDGGTEDFDFGSCMSALGVKVGNSTDKFGRSRFHCFDPEVHLNGIYPDWYYEYDANGAKKGSDSISDYAISFHYIEPAGMYGLEYFIYHLEPYGIEAGYQELNQDSS